MIHPTAIVAAGARIDPTAKIGPWCRVDEHVVIGANCELISHVVVAGHTTIGAENRIFPFACIGHEPQDLKYRGEPSVVEIGDRNTIREGVSIHPGTEGGGMLTRIGNDNLLMGYVHVAHDCLIGNRTIMANNVTLAGHIEVHDYAIIGGMTAIHQFLRIGAHAMVGGMSGVVKDIPPFCLTAGGYRPGLVGLNVVGLKRRGFSDETIALLKQLYRTLLQGGGKLESRLQAARDLAGDNAQALQLIDFVATAKKGITLHRRDDE